MATSIQNTPAPPPVKRQLNWLAGILSYLVPGLGQIVQGRIAKGVLFLVCVYGLFFYGTYIGSGTVTISGRKYAVTSNVYLPSDLAPNEKAPGTRSGVIPDFLINRWQYIGQFWVGVAAWPAIFQFRSFDPVKHAELERLADEAGRAVLDAEKADPADKEAAQKTAEEALEKVAEKERELALPVIGSFQREPSQASINAIHNAGDKRLELAWVFTVIAGVLNILVIYDAVAGPAVLTANEKKG